MSTSSSPRRPHPYFPVPVEISTKSSLIKRAVDDGLKLYQLKVDDHPLISSILETHPDFYQDACHHSVMNTYEDKEGTRFHHLFVRVDDSEKYYIISTIKDMAIWG